MTLRVIGAGFGRTGTVSLQAALERLGFAPCDHMGEVFRHPERAVLWEEAAQAKARAEGFDWERLYECYTATTDWPGAYFWRELVAFYPAAKVVLSVRDPERWYESMRRTIHPMRQNPDIARRLAASLGLAAPPDWLPRLVDRIVFDGTFGGRFEDRVGAIRVFEAHASAVIAAIPSDRLLVFDANQGWGPLCRFLERPVPEGEPFPRLNDSASVEARLRRGPDAVQPPEDDLSRRVKPAG